jgi:hypothetical protein
MHLEDAPPKTRPSNPDPEIAAVEQPSTAFIGRCPQLD